MNRDRSGFTLLEVLISVLILGMLILLLDQGFAFGVRATATQQHAQDQHGDLQAVDRAIRQMITQADPGALSQPAPFRGAAGSLNWVTVLPDAATGAPERVDAMLFASGGQLRLRWIRERHVIRFGPAPKPQELALLSGVGGLELGYLSTGGWTSRWGSPRLPALVRVTLRFTDPHRTWPPIEAAPMRGPLPR